MYRWHVRTKENIARVRKDEAEAAERDRQEQIRIDSANREARLNLLKQKSKQKLSKFNIEQNSSVNESNVHSKHIDLFTNFEHAVQTTNKDHDKEAKERKEEYEKKIGFLTYLGQDTNEALGKKNWYELPPEVSRFTRPDHVKETYEKLVLKDEDGKPKKKKYDKRDGEIDWKTKQTLDPLNTFRSVNKKKTENKYPKISSITASLISTEQKETKSKKDESKSLQELREARLRREQQEKHKTDIFLKKISGTNTATEEVEPKKIIPKYNSQFNPELARQNYR